MIIPVKKKTLNNAGHIDAKLIDFSEICQKNPSEIGCFLLIVSWRSFPVKSADFSMNLPLKILRNLTFSAKMPRNRSIFLRILTFLPRKSDEIGQFFRKFWLFSRENLAKLADFSATLPLKIPLNFAFFSAKYQKPCQREQQSTEAQSLRPPSSPELQGSQSYG